MCKCNFDDFDKFNRLSIFHSNNSSYVMSCFILPDGLCDEIESMIARFFRGGGGCLALGFTLDKLE